MVKRGVQDGVIIACFHSSVLLFSGFVNSISAKLTPAPTRVGMKKENRSLCLILIEIISSACKIEVRATPN